MPSWKQLQLEYERLIVSIPYWLLPEPQNITFMGCGLYHSKQSLPSENLIKEFTQELFCIIKELQAVEAGL